MKKGIYALLPHLMPMEPFISYFPERLPVILLAGLPASGVAYRLNKSQTVT